MTTDAVAVSPARRGRAVVRRWPSGWVRRALPWAVVVLYVAGVAAYLLLDGRLGGQGLDVGEGVALFLGFGMFAAMGALLIARRPGNALGWLMAGAALLLVAGGTGDMYAAWVMTSRGQPDALAVVGAWLQSWYWFVLLGVVFVFLPLLFPDGRLPSRRWWPVPACAAAAILGASVLGMLTGTLRGQEVGYRIDNPVGIDGLPPVEELPVFGALSIALGLGVVGAVAAVVVRFWRSRGAQRQQMKWFLVAVAPAALAPLEGVVPVVGSVVFAWVLIGMPVAVAVAVLRYRLDGVDVVINRTLVYGSMTLLVIGVYVVVVGYLAAVLRRENDLMVALIGTAVVAVLFAPARDRLQKEVDRLLYGRRSEPYSALAQLGERLQATIAPDAVLPTIVSTVREALRLPYAAIRLKDDLPPVSDGEPETMTETLPLTHHGAPVGELVLGLRPGEDAFSPADRRLLADLARQAGVAVSAVRLTADLQHSRGRLVAAREEERRRLRRDLHDGLGAQLAGLTVQTGVLRGLIRRDPAAAERLAAELREELRTAIGDIRRLVHGLRPPALDELGLVGAVERLAEGLGADTTGPRVSVEVPRPLARLPAAVEVAAYRITQEALTNVVRHAHAACCTVRLVAGPGDLTVEVTDDGRGLSRATEAAGVGLSSMRERAAEVGGTCSVEERPDSGTRVLARLPVTEDA